MIYLDYNATTPVDSAVAEAMQPFLREQYGNPSNSYELGQYAKTAIEFARKQLASLIGAEPDEVIFTGCGSEANNMVIKGMAFAQSNKGKHFITSTIEHPSVLAPLAFLSRQGFDVTYLPVDGNGRVSPNDLRHALRSDTLLVSIMHSNNEVGTLQPIKELAAICHDRGVPFHTDASQSLGKVSVDVDALQVDFLTAAGHKLYAPKGIGALFIRQGCHIEPLIHGASQERGTRAGTESVPLIVGLGKAAELATRLLPDARIRQLRDSFLSSLVEQFGTRVTVNHIPDESLPNTLNVSFLGQEGWSILAGIPELLASTGSACHSGSKSVSPVLKAMGIPETVAFGAIRFSIGRFTSQDDITQAIRLLVDFNARR